MKTNCPLCGIPFSLDGLIDHHDMAETLRLLHSINPNLERQLVRYLSFFRPDKTKTLSWSRGYSLLSELLPDIRAEQICRNGKPYAAPVEAWCWAVEQMFFTRDNMKLPLKSHGYLYQVLSTWTPKEKITVFPSGTTDAITEEKSKTFEGMDNLGELAGWIPDGL